MSSFYGSGGVSGGGSGSSQPAAAQTYICGSNEYDAVSGLPTVADPEQGIFYLVPTSSQDNKNLFNEYIYKNGRYELFGGGAVDIETALENLVDGSEIGSVRGISTAEESETYVVAPFAFAEGLDTMASGLASHAEGVSGITVGTGAHVEGSSQMYEESCIMTGEAGATTYTCTNFDEMRGGIMRFEAGQFLLINSQLYQIENVDHGNETITFNKTLNENTALSSETVVFRKLSSASQEGSHAEGIFATASNEASHAEGYNGIASGESSHAEGYQTRAFGNYSHTEGNSTKAFNSSSHAEGLYARALESCDHAEGNTTTASGGSSHAEGSNTIASGGSSHAEGWYTIASGYYTHAEGSLGIAVGEGAHVEGSVNSSVFYCTMTGAANATTYTYTNFGGADSNNMDTLLKVGQYLSIYSQPYKIMAIDSATITFDKTLNTTSGLSSQKIYFRIMNTALGEGSHTEGIGTITTGNASHAEGSNTIASGEAAHAEGEATTAQGYKSHAEGYQTVAEGEGSHAEGFFGIASGEGSHVEGSSYDALISCEMTGAANATTYTCTNFNPIDITELRKGQYLLINSQLYEILDIDVINNTITFDHTLNTNSALSSTEIYFITPNIALESSSHAEGYQTMASGYAAHAEGISTTASNNSAHAEGVATIASGYFSHTEGSGTVASNNNTHAEGGGTVASNDSAHAEGAGTVASGYFSHTEGSGTTASADSAHAEGIATTASADSAHAEGFGVIVSGYAAHAEGCNTTASGDYSHAEGFETTANHRSQHVFGRYNIADDATNVSSGEGNYVEIVGNGTDISSRSNARTLDWNGNEVLAGKLTVGTGPVNNMDVATKQYVDEHSSSGGLQNLVDGSTSGSVRGISTAAENVDYTMGNNAFAEGAGTKAIGAKSHAEGTGTIASGNQSHAEGYYTVASGTQSHAEGYYTTASNYDSHAEGYYTIASGRHSHSEGVSSEFTTRTINNVEYTQAGAYGQASHSEGTNNLAIGEHSHSEGIGTIASNYASHAEGAGSIASNQYSHAEGAGTTASGLGSHAEGTGTTASGQISHSEGSGTIASGYISHAEGINATASGYISHAEGASTTASGDYSHAEGSNTIASGNYSHVEGTGTIASGSQSHAEGGGTTASGNYSHAEGGGGYFTYLLTGEANATTYTYTKAFQSEAVYTDFKVGQDIIIDTKHYQITAVGNNSFTLDKTISETALSSTQKSIGVSSSVTSSGGHAEGLYTFVTGVAGHAEGYDTVAIGSYSHAEGDQTKASGINSHAEGYKTTASGYYAHVEGKGTIANHESQHVFGEYNIPDPSTEVSPLRGNYVEIVGNGVDANSKSNARTLDWDGNETLAGTLTVAADPQNDMEVATKQYVDTNGFTPAAKMALLDCFKYIAWIDENGRNYYNALKIALGIAEENQGWDYEWSVEDEEIPEGMSYSTFSWTAESGALRVTECNLNFDCIGDSELQIECKWYSTSGSGTMQNPQIVLCNGTSSTGNAGAKFFGNPTSGRNIQSNVSGTTADTGISGDVYHTYNLKSVNGQLTLTVDGTVVVSGSGVTNNQYISYTGITSNGTSGCGLFIKSIKFKEL